VSEQVYLTAVEFELENARAARSQVVHNSLAMHLTMCQLSGLIEELIVADLGRNRLQGAESRSGWEIIPNEEGRPATRQNLCDGVLVSRLAITFLKPSGLFERRTDAFDLREITPFGAYTPKLAAVPRFGSGHAVPQWFDEWQQWVQAG
jgi:hypothetical protein